MNTITREQYPYDWDSIIEEEDYDKTTKSHRRGSTFYITLRYTLNEKTLPELPELHGVWESDTLTWSDDWGLDSEVDTLYRVEEKEEITVKKTYTRVKE